MQPRGQCHGRHWLYVGIEARGRLWLYVGIEARAILKLFTCGRHRCGVGRCVVATCKRADRQCTSGSARRGRRCHMNRTVLVRPQHRLQVGHEGVECRHWHTTRPCREVGRLDCRKPDRRSHELEKDWHQDAAPRPSSASSITQSDWTACSDHATTTQRAWSSARPIWLRQVWPAGMRRSQNTDQPRATSAATTGRPTPRPRGRS